MISALCSGQKKELVVLLALAALGCQRPARRPLDSTTIAQWQRDSANFLRDSIKWAHDSTVRDSVFRTINTDSLYRLYRAMLVAPNPVPFMGAAQCEGTRLMFRYGSVLAGAAMRRMQDTLIKPGEKAAWKRVDSRLSGMSVEENLSIGVSTRKCGPLGPEVDTVDGTDLQGIEHKPTRPQPPRQ